MAEYLAPGVYVEEVSHLPPTIAPVETDVAAFIGPAGSGPQAPQRVTRFSEFEQLYQIDAASGDLLAYAVRAFFDNGGATAWIARTSSAPDGVDAALAALGFIEEITLIAAPGASPEAQGSLVRHCEAKHDRIAILDGPAPPASVTDLDPRAGDPVADSSYAACYAPWIAVPTLDGKARLFVPPSGAVCGIIARVERERGVWKAPANEVIAGALGLETQIDKAMQELLDPRGVNCIRAFPDRGIRLWGARTLSRDPEWKYVTLRRFLIFLERSIDRGLQWAVFEPNEAPLWAKARGAVEDFLLGLWRQGALQGSKPEQAFFVKADRTTMTQDDIDNGRLVLLIGVAALRPAEFVIVRIVQTVAESG